MASEFGSDAVERTINLDDWRISIINACNQGNLTEVQGLIDGAFEGRVSILDVRNGGIRLQPNDINIDFVVVKTNDIVQVRS